jgi:hypothetical protein
LVLYPVPVVNLIRLAIGALSIRTDLIFGKDNPRNLNCYQFENWEKSLASLFRPRCSPALTKSSNKQAPCPLLALSEHGQLHRLITEHGTSVAENPVALPPVPQGARHAANSQVRSISTANRKTAMPEVRLANVSFKDRTV